MSTGSNFMDWQQMDKESRLLIDEDFSWSEPPRRGRRRITERAAPTRSAAEEPFRASRRTAVLEYESDPRHDHYELEPHYGEPELRHEPEPRRDHWDQPTTSHSHFDALMAEWNANYGADARDDFDAPAERAFDLSDPGPGPMGQGARRTVVITGRGDDRYLPAPRQRRSSELRFHERSGFSPDRAGLWAVLLGIALVIGAIAH